LAPLLAADEPQSIAERRGQWCAAAAFVFVGLSLAAPTLKSGIWEPFELKSIELARRIAVGLFGAKGLALAGATNALPTRGEVDRGELPFTSMALGLRLFGLHAWAGRLPLVLAALAGLAATYLVVRRLGSRSAATFSVLVLGTMPLYFLHARTMLGDGMCMAALAVAQAGLTLALFDRGSVRLRGGFLALGLLGLVAGLLTRGLLLGVAVPLCGPALAWLVLRLAGTQSRDRITDACGAGLLVLGIAATALGALLLSRALDAPERYFLWLGFGINQPAVPPTFDSVVGALGHGLFPWSALVPVALARLMGFGSASPSLDTGERGLRFSCLMTAALGYAVWGGIAPDAGLLPFGPVAALAVIVALALAELDRGAPASRAAGMAGAALLVLLLADFLNEPEHAFVPFGIEGAHFPESFKTAGHPLYLIGTLFAALTFFAALLESDAADGAPFARRDYVAWLETVRDLWNGNLLFGACVAEAALLGFVGFDLLGERIPALSRFAAANETTRALGRVAWLALPVLFVLPLLTLVLRDAVRALELARQRFRFGGWLPSRGALAALGPVAFGSALSLGYYPALAAQLSPEESFDAFLRLARPGEELGVVGAGSATAPYAAGRSVVALEDTNKAASWLFGAERRRWLMLRSDELGGLNSRYRAHFHRGNLPVLDARSSEILLASSELLPGQKNENPLNRDVFDQAPHPTHPLDSNLGDELDVLGWDVTDLDGRPVKNIAPGRRYDFVLYFHVVNRILGAWETFVHIDGFQRRYNGDHPTLDGRYPFALWNVGDFIADRHEIKLEPNFTRGTYHVFVGLYLGARRLAVRRGPHDDDRIDAGEIFVE
jgi:4-amino-4-deoxy-L-arabinose transferase-like glycosyltransferase